MDKEAGIIKEESGEKRQKRWYRDFGRLYKGPAISFRVQKTQTACFYFVMILHTSRQKMHVWLTQPSAESNRLRVLFTCSFIRLSA